MFDSLADRAKQDEGATKTREVVVRWAVVMGLAVVLFGGLYLVVQHLGG